MLNSNETADRKPIRNTKILPKHYLPWNISRDRLEEIQANQIAVGGTPMAINDSDYYTTPRFIQSTNNVLSKYRHAPITDAFYKKFERQKRFGRV